MEKFHRVSNLFTMPNLLLACLQRQMGKHRNPQKHISKVRAEKVKNEWQEKQNAELNTVYNTYKSIIYMYVDGYLCPFVLLPSYVEIRNILCALYDHFRVSLEHVIPAMFTVPFLGIELFHTGCKVSKETAMRRVLQFDKNPFKILIIQEI